MAGGGGNRRATRKGSSSEAGAAGLGGGDGGSAGRELICPDTLPATLIGPAAEGCAVGDILDVTRVATPTPPRVVCVHRVTGTPVGAIGGIPGLGRLLDCLEAGVGYEATVDAVLGGRVDVTIRKV